MSPRPASIVPSTATTPVTTGTNTAARAAAGGGGGIGAILVGGVRHTSKRRSRRPIFQHRNSNNNSNSSKSKTTTPFSTARSTRTTATIGKVKQQHDLHQRLDKYDVRDDRGFNNVASTFQSSSWSSLRSIQEVMGFDADAHEKRLMQPIDESSQLASGEAAAFDMEYDKDIGNDQHPVATTWTSAEHAKSLPQSSWELHHMILAEIWSRDWWKVLYRIQITSCPVLPVTAAVVYGHNYTSLPSFSPNDNIDSDLLALILFVATIGLPVYTALLMILQGRFYRQYVLPVPWNEILIRLEAEMYQFRTRSDVYRQKATKQPGFAENQSSDDVGSELATMSARELFCQRVRDLWEQQVVAKMPTKAVAEYFWGESSDDEAFVDFERGQYAAPNAESRTPWASHHLHAPQVVSKANVTKADAKEEKRSNRAVEDDYTRHSDLPCMIQDLVRRSKSEEALLSRSNSKTDQTSSRSEATISLVDVEAPADDVMPSPPPAAVSRHEPTETTPMLSTLSPQTKRQHTEVNPIIADDGCSPMSVSEYMQSRFVKLHTSNQKRLAWLGYQQLFLNRSIQLLTLVVTVLAFASLTWVVPIVMAMIAALTGILVTGAYDQSIPLQRAIVGELDIIQNEWQKQPQHSEINAGPSTNDDEVLVERTEAIMIKGAAIFSLGQT